LHAALPYKRFEEFFQSKVPKGSFGILCVDFKALMCTVSDDGTVEIFDSHGSTCPLIVGGLAPAYHAIFHTMKAAAYYLSIHCKIMTFQPLKFIPVHFISSTLKP
jgi:hypothetical protein